MSAPIYSDEFKNSTITPPCELRPIEVSLPKTVAFTGRFIKYELLGDWLKIIEYEERQP